jgi:hypothetical protein
MKTKLTFEQWMSKINKRLETICGISTDDLPDMCYADMYEHGATVSEVVAEVLEDNGFGG